MDSDPSSDLGRIISERRRELGLSQEELASRASVAKATIQNIELGRRTPRGKTLRALTEALGLRPGDLTGQPGQRGAAEAQRPSSEVERAILTDPSLTDDERLRFLRMLYAVKGWEWPAGQGLGVGEPPESQSPHGPASEVI